ncbi:MAG: hypothetical protein GX799_04865 [Crenarchaeota archaeon]|nr:hypothetical protein [Thermoproteota archaeon]
METSQFAKLCIITGTLLTNNDSTPVNLSMTLDSWNPQDAAKLSLFMQPNEPLNFSNHDKNY